MMTSLNLTFESGIDLWAALKGCKDTVTTLAANVQDLHESVVGEVNTHRNLQRFVGGDAKVSKDGDMAHRTTTGDGRATNVADNMNQAYDKLYGKVNILFNSSEFSNILVLFYSLILRL